MYQFSRSIYRELVPEVIEDRGGANRLAFLKACEAAFERLAADRHYFARPARALFRDVRIYFPISSQMRVYRVIERHMALATAYVDRALAAGRSLDGTSLTCQASTRKGAPCRRDPVPGSRYCPSHKHLEEGFATTAA
ncbi:MAG: hypothetical protein IRZ21_12555 [Thermoleophilaceae bacterium]|nr:hypothetical protein [Thermoleophilaceae bacterium]